MMMRRSHRLGSVPMTPDQVDFASLTHWIKLDGLPQSAPAKDVMGHPGTPLALMANRLAALGSLGGHLKAGDIVIAGALVRSVEVKAGARLHADFGPLGTIDLDLVQGMVRLWAEVISQANTRSRLLFPALLCGWTRQ